MAQQKETPTPHPDDVLEHMEHEIEDLEHVSRLKRWAVWTTTVVVVAGLIAAFAWYLVSPPTATSSRLVYVPDSASAIELGAPKGVTLSAPPARLSWESVAGRLQYRVRIYERGEGSPLFDRFTIDPFVELTPAERARIAKGKTYVWTVVAQGQNGATLGAGQSTFRVR